jgi:acylphosphatase
MACVMAIQAKRIVVHGRVQGVGFRFFVQHTGNHLGVTGNVRNCPDATVEILVEGEPRRIAQFLREVEKGPSLSRVNRVDVYDTEPSGDYGSFQIEGW